MKKVLFACLLTGFAFMGCMVRAQGFEQEIRQHREAYKNEFLTTANSPLGAPDLAYLRFYEPDSGYRLRAKFVATPASEPFAMLTYSGQRKQYVKYGELQFELQGKRDTLSVYQSLDLRRLPQYRDYLFVPFKDLTNGEGTYGGGRYLDFTIKDIQGSTSLLDFNKAYNPYCAYAEGYNCPIPPQENHLSARIEAGEMNFGKEH
ncbi:DUF1684 domain-containing protein [Salmonirosea aquatica]|uniref:DUF1684 domain-containing protein n=1 Tax=Salmonirosea aquatica TaxID=2654236 RepID=A0A7C9BE22_9BACT|nr:DUF1684 domain-containing protein [Cytophagaceae bacterium SJW1-29]